MRRPHRNIEIFSMSVLDMFASALGAFIMVAVILFPYFKKDVSQEVAAAKNTLSQRSAALDTVKAQARQIEEQVRKQDEQVKEVRDTQASLNVCKQGLNQCQVSVAKNFLVVEVQWNSQANVDLHVTDPLGNEYFWRKTNRCECDFPGQKARLSVDSFGSARGGIEVWVDPEVRPGVYYVDYVIDRAPTTAVSVAGVVIDRLGTHKIDGKTIGGGETAGREARIRAAQIEIGADGKLNMR